MRTLVLTNPSNKNWTPSYVVYMICPFPSLRRNSLWCFLEQVSNSNPTSRMLLKHEISMTKYIKCWHIWKQNSNASDEILCNANKGFPNISRAFVPVCQSYGYTDIERHTADTIVLWPNPKQWVIVHTSDLMMIIRQSIYILSPNNLLVVGLLIIAVITMPFMSGSLSI